MFTKTESAAALNPQEVGTAVCGFLEKMSGVDDLMNDIVNAYASLLCIVDEENVYRVKCVGETLFCMMTLVACIAGREESVR